MARNPISLAIVTGASAGIGAATARRLTAAGFHVLGGVRREEDAQTLRTAGIEAVKLDITDPDHIASLVERVARDHEGRHLGVLVNNAGVPMNVPVEIFPLSEWRRLFEVNFFGHIAVTQALLPALVRGRGRIVNVSSIGGRIAMPTYGPYAATKFALEAVSDALRQELATTGVEVIVIEPGSVRTAMLDKASAASGSLTEMMTEGQRHRYGALVAAIAAQTASANGWGVTPEVAAQVILKAIVARRPRARYTVGNDAVVMSVMARFLSDRAKDRLLALALRPHRSTKD